MRKNGEATYVSYLLGDLGQLCASSKPLYLIRKHVIDFLYSIADY